MTVIAWDGHTLAADKRGTNGGWVFPVTKIQRVGDVLVGVSGNLARGHERIAWLAKGADPTTYPEQPSDDSGYLFVVHRSGRVERYETTGYPIVIEAPIAASGSARDFALAAMACGRTAVEAVAVACALSADCGNGVDALTFEDTNMDTSERSAATVVRLHGKPLMRDAGGLIHGESLALTDEERARLPALGECEPDAPMVLGTGLA